MSDQTKTKQTRLRLSVNGCPLCGGGESGDDRLLAVVKMTGREIILGVHKDCFDEVFAAQEAQRRAI
jgi:hypothetical protein